MMRQESRGKRIGSIVALAALPLIAVTAYAVTSFASVERPLQRIANEAALASVNALAASHDPSEEGRTAISTAAARRAVGERSAQVRAVTPSRAELKVSIELIDPATRASAVATARYLPPSEGRAEQHAAAVDASGTRRN